MSYNDAQSIFETQTPRPRHRAGVQFGVGFCNLSILEKMTKRQKIAAAKKYLLEAYKSGECYQALHKNQFVKKAIEIAAGNKFEEKLKVAEKQVEKIQ